jgi:2-polyprenyl-6-methoxyphenol hydroxylase-like FAD-dependent oxidoreductase
MMNHAIVIGGSIAGLMSARLLSDHFDHVTIIDRDELPEDVDFRKGVPQGRHPHALLKRGEIIMEAAFPGFVNELLQAGATQMNYGNDLPWYSVGAWRLPFKSSLVGIACSRPLVEGTIRKRMMANPKFTFVQKAEVTGLLTDAGKTHATGVTLRARDGGEASTLEGDLVVDASGRDSHSMEWLTALGYPTPKESVVNAHPGYATRIFKRPEGSIPFIYVQPAAPKLTRGAIITPMEGNRWHATMIGMSKDYPDTTEEGFLEFARSLPVPHIYDMLKNAEPVSPVWGYRRAENRWRHYESLPKYLENFVLLGDAVLGFNPVYGQGMTTASISAEALSLALGEHLKASRSLEGFAAKFQKKLAKIVAVPWQIATGEDTRWPNTEMNIPKPGFPDTLIAKYVERVLIVSNTDPVVCERFFYVQNMLEAPTVLFKPAIMMRVLGGPQEMQPSFAAPTIRTAHA